MPGLLAIPAFWEKYCGPDIDVVRPHLRVTDVEGTLYPCPKLHTGYCPRKIVDYGNGEFAALCRDPHEICARVPLTQRDVLAQRLDVTSFTRMLAGPLGIRWQEPVLRDDGVWGIGLSDRRDTRARPVFLALLPETRRFVAVTYRLLLNASGPFVLVAPTNRHRTIEVQELLHQRGVSFLSLEEHLQLDGTGRLVAVDPQDAGGGIAPTPKEDRRRVVKEFTARNHCKVRDIQEAAGVDEADYYKWLRGKTPDHYSTSAAIERVLHDGLPRRMERDGRTGSRPRSSAVSRVQRA
jgi:hypothetical protein